jgi:hypothetical protein
LEEVETHVNYPDFFLASRKKITRPEEEIEQLMESGWYHEKRKKNRLLCIFFFRWLIVRFFFFSFSFFLFKEYIVHAPYLEHEATPEVGRGEEEEHVEEPTAHEEITTTPERFRPPPSPGAPELPSVEEPEVQPAPPSPYVRSPTPARESPPTEVPEPQPKAPQVPPRVEKRKRIELDEVVSYDRKFETFFFFSIQLNLFWINFLVSLSYSVITANLNNTTNVVRESLYPYAPASKRALLRRERELTGIETILIQPSIPGLAHELRSYYSRLLVEIPPTQGNLHIDYMYS